MMALEDIRTLTEVCRDALRYSTRLNELGQEELAQVVRRSASLGLFILAEEEEKLPNARLKRCSLGQF
jgi:hypothetical protein